MASDKAYSKIESIVMEKVFSLENENTQLRNDLAVAQAKLEVYDRIVNVSDSQKTIGFEQPMRGGNE